MICKNCKHEIPDNALFCGFCGEKIPVNENEGNNDVQMDNKTCPLCGSNVGIDALFCGECGYRFEQSELAHSSNKNEDYTEQDGSETIPEVIPNDVSGFPYTKSTEDTENVEDTEDIEDIEDTVETPHNTSHTKTKKKNKNIFPTIICASILVICIAVSAVLISKFFANNSDEKLDVIENESTNIDDKTAMTDNNEDVNNINDDADLAEQDDSEEDENDDKKDYILPTDTEYISFEDLEGFSKDEVALIRNEIYARHGYQFQSEVYAEYFSKKEWYHPNPNFSDTEFSEIELANKDTIVAFEEEKGWR